MDEMVDSAHERGMREALEILRKRKGNPPSR
jgi:hypothetical protein